MFNRRSFLIGAAAIVLSAGHSWAAPKLTADKPCYGANTAVKYTGEGFGVNKEVEIYTATNDLAPTWLETIKTGPQGTLQGATTTPSEGRTGDEAKFTVEARQGNKTDVSAKIVVKVVGVVVKPKVVGDEDTQGLVDLRATGFIGDYDALYAHYIVDEKEYKTVLVGKLDKSCGSLLVKYKKFPFKPIPAGVYVVQFDPYEKYAVSKRPFVTQCCTTVAETIK